MKYSLIFLACLVGVSLSAPAIYETPSMTTEDGGFEGGIVGGISDSDSDAAEEVALAESVHSLMYVADSECNFNVEKVLSHSVQVVSGLLHRISYTMKADERFCEVLTCKAQVWSQPWISDTPKINKYECE